MGKRRKKSAVKVAPAPALAADGKSGSKGKRNAEGDIEKAAKKQKAAPVKVVPVENDLSKAKISSDENDEDMPPKEPVAKKMEESSERSHSEDEDTTAKIVGSSKAFVSEKTVFVGNLSFNVDKEQVKQFFQEAGDIIDIRVPTSDDGSSRGFAHVEFATTEAAQKACKLNGFNLMGRPVRLDIAQERGAFTPGSGKDTSGQNSSSTAFIKGFDSSLGQDQIRSSLLKHFSSCGEITKVRIPKDLQTGASKGIAYMVFSDNSSVSKAKELSGSDLGGFSLYVDEAYDVGGRTGSTRGRSDSRGRRGRSFGRGDRGRGGRGGAPHRQSAATASTLQGRRYLAVMNERAGAISFSEDVPAMFLQKLLG